MSYDEIDAQHDAMVQAMYDSFFDDRATFFTRDTLGGYRFNVTRATLAEQGFDTGARTPGIPSLGSDDVLTMPRGKPYLTGRWDIPGTYQLTCTLHPEMNLKVVVDS